MEAAVELLKHVVGARGAAAVHVDGGERRGGEDRVPLKLRGEPCSCSFSSKAEIQYAVRAAATGNLTQ